MYATRPLRLWKPPAVRPAKEKLNSHDSLTTKCGAMQSHEVVKRHYMSRSRINQLQAPLCAIRCLRPYPQVFASVTGCVCDAVCAGVCVAFAPIPAYCLRPCLVTLA